MNKHAENLTNEMNLLVGELKHFLLEIYGNNLKGLYLYGSHVRQEEKTGSDVDVIIVLKEFDKYWTEIQRTSHIVSNLSLKYGMTISPVRVRETDWLSADSPFLNIVRSESVAA